MCKPNVHNNSGEQVPSNTNGKFLITIENAPPPPPLERMNIYFVDKINTVRNGYR